MLLRKLLKPLLATPMRSVEGPEGGLTGGACEQLAMRPAPSNRLSTPTGDQLNGTRRLLRTETLGAIFGWFKAVLVLARRFSRVLYFTTLSAGPHGTSTALAASSSSVPPSERQ